MKKPPDPKKRDDKHLMVTRKINLERIIGSEENKINELNNEEVSRKIQDVVTRVNNIVFHTTHFLELYFLYLFHNKKEERPEITEAFIGFCMKVVTEESKDGRSDCRKEENFEILSKLKMFYKAHYQPLLGQKPEEQKVLSEKLENFLNYEEKDILKNIKNNIIAHFENYCKEWVNKVFQLKRLHEEINKSNLSVDDKKETKGNASFELRCVKKDLLTPLGTPYSSQSQYHDWLDEVKPNIITKSIFNEKGINKFKYDIKANTLDYLYSFIFIIDQLRIFGRNLQCIPLRSSFTPKYITIDSMSLITIMGSKKIINDDFPFMKNKQTIWQSFFNLKHKAFKRKDYVFHHMIKTDGVGASILFHRSDQNEAKTKEPKSTFTEFYVDQLDMVNFKDFKIVGIDPGKDDLIHCTDGKNNFFRYTANQRRLETKKKKYAKINEKLKLKTIIDQKSVKQWETELSFYRKCSTNFQEFKDYLSKKLPLYKKLEKYYHDKLRRKLKWNTYMNTQRSEDNMLNNFEQKFGEPKNTLVCIGDYDQKGYHMKGKEPSKGKGFRNLFRRRGYRVFLVDEFRTSLKCHKCHQDNEKFHWRENHKPIRNEETYQETILVHGLLRCQSANGCGTIWNRDVNGCLNIQMLAEKALNNRRRPLEFRRPPKIKNSRMCGEVLDSSILT